MPPDSSVAAEVERPAESEIYRRMWDFPQYRAVAPGEEVAQVFLQQARPRPGSSVIDMGCGTGRGALALAVMGDLDVTLMDFAPNCLDDDIRPILEQQAHRMRFVQADLTQPLPKQAEYGFCTDVLEHIPPELVDKVLDNCLLAAQHVFFQISTVDDVCGALIGHPLHLSVHPYEWWLKKFRDRDCVVQWSANAPGACMFYVSAWVDGKAIVDVGVLNIEAQAARANVERNIARGFAQVQPHQTNDVDVMILGGGPGLNEHLAEIRALRDDGVKLITLNGSHDWCLDHDLVPSAQVIVDARAFNARFTRRPVDGCKYFIASQCAPEVLDGLPADRTFLWHTTAETYRDLLDAAYDAWWGVPGGSTVLLRAIPLFRMLGFRRFHLFGCDSCLSGDLHHAYAQAENDGDPVVPVNMGGRIFHCHPWMVSQAQEFMDLIRYLGEEIELQVHGDGLLSFILKTGARLADEDAARSVGTAPSDLV